MFEFAVGVVVGAAFSPFWMKVWNFVTEQWQKFSQTDKTKE